MASRAASKTDISSKTAFVQPMITSLFGPGRTTAASKNGALRSATQVSKDGAQKSRKRKSVTGDEEDPDCTVVNPNLLTTSVRSSTKKPFTTPLPSAKRQKTSRYSTGSELENSPAGDTTLVGTPGSGMAKRSVNTPATSKGKSAHAAWIDVKKAWEGQRPVSAASLAQHSQPTTQSSLNAFGFTIEHSSTPIQASAPHRPHVFSLAFEEEEDFDFDAMAPVLSSQTPAEVPLESPFKFITSSSRSPSPDLLSPIKTKLPHRRPLMSLPIARLSKPAPSSTFENFAPMPASQSTVSTLLEPNVINPLFPARPINPRPGMRSRTASDVNRRHHSSSSSVFGEEVAFTMPPSLPDTSMVSSDLPSESSSPVLDSSIAKILLKGLDIQPHETEELLPDDLSLAALASDNPPEQGPEAHKTTPPILPSTMSLDHATMAFTMPPTIPNSTLAMDLADYLSSSDA
ncbi:hypothetical protein DACRYDRAFT_103068 [Dacryopinax primogenitus]|uniref:Uncharacterized protein n=1 Tax=Dacryopinax primogenitus (strain DJM 731) TaxID=1858805 RepID=M5GC96_DACPD|nr:uncharacterized protein DACRYDRAFT_103068 [Dacryopinax primogenitus]EJU06120.1 hypothetical protein DACRYDRAFT_103068 [Dacryopinax primogenitus]